MAKTRVYSGIEDNYVTSFSTVTYNFGLTNYFTVASGSGGIQNALIRLHKNLIPAGTINSVKIGLTQYAASIATDLTLKFYRITDANTWVEGRTNFAATSGTSCWSYAKYATQAWAGSAGCSTSGTDYYTDASPPTATFFSGSVASTQQTASLPAVWFTDWRDGIRVNNGIIIRTDSVAASNQFYSTEGSTYAYQPYFEFDYTPLNSNIVTKRIDYQYFQDATIVSGTNGNYNYGAATSVSIQPQTTLQRALLRFNSSSIPQGTIVAARLYHQYSTSVFNQIYAYAITDANTWVEGTGSGAALQNGSCCWNYAKYNTQAWAGSIGCGTEGVDYDTDADPPSTKTRNELIYLSLRPEWLTAWRDGTRVNNGILIKANLLNSAVSTFHSSVAGNQRPYVEVDYVPNSSIIKTQKIWGPDAISDNSLSSGAPTYNYGAATLVYLGTNSNWVGLMRCDLSSIPTDAVIKGFRLRWIGNFIPEGRIASIHRITDANIWVEGTKNGTAAAVGESNWNWARSGSVAWAGSAGCNTEGVDYDANITPITVTLSNTYGSTELPISWVQDWISGARVNNGIRLKETSAVAGALQIYGSDYVGQATHFEVDYELPINQTYKKVGELQTDIQETEILGSALGANYSAQNFGNAATVRAGKSDEYKQLWKLPSSAIPAGQIYTASFIFLQSSADTFKQLVAYPIAAANNWVEGTGTGQPQSGSVCWDWAQSGSLAWAGSVGCSTSGTDYINSSSFFYTNDWEYAIPFKWDLPVAWFTNWRDGVWTNNGFMVYMNNATTTQRFYIYASHPKSINQPYLPYFLFTVPTETGVAYRKIDFISWKIP